MKAMKKNDGVSPVIAVILMVAITVVLAGVVFLWAQSFTDDADGGVETINVKASADGSDDDLVFEVISGTMKWDDYKILINATTEVTTTAALESSAGEMATFTAAAGPPSFFTGTIEYNVRIINIADNAVVWEDDIIATA